MTYFTSIIIYSLISFSIVTVFQKQIMENGWITQEDIYETASKGRLFNTIKFICIHSIPIFRLIVVITLAAMAFTEKDMWS